MKLTEKRPVSDRILVAAFPTAKERGDLVQFGSLVGFSDYTTAQGEEGSVCVGKQIAVLNTAKSNLSSATVGSDVYVTSAGALSATAEDNKLLGTVVAVGADTIDIAVTG